MFGSLSGASVDNISFTLNPYIISLGDSPVDDVGELFRLACKAGSAFTTLYIGILCDQVSKHYLHGLICSFG